MRESGDVLVRAKRAHGFRIFGVHKDDAGSSCDALETVQPALPDDI